MSTELWTSGDIAKEIGVGNTAVCNWASRGAIPDPAFTTVKGINLWSEEQARGIIAAAKQRGTNTRRRAAAIAEQKRRKQAVLDIAVNALSK